MLVSPLSCWYWVTRVHKKGFSISGPWFSSLTGSLYNPFFFFFFPKDVLWKFNFLERIGWEDQGTGEDLMSWFEAFSIQHAQSLSVFIFMIIKHPVFSAFHLLIILLSFPWFVYETRRRAHWLTDWRTTLALITPYLPSSHHTLWWLHSSCLSFLREGLSRTPEEKGKRLRIERPACLVGATQRFHFFHHHTTTTGRWR